MKRMELCRAVGSMEQLAYVREVRDLASGQRLIEVENGRLRFTVLPDRGLDIASLRFDGKNMSFMAKAGLQHEKSTDILGGLFFTCGPDNVGPAENGLPMHGSFRNTSAEHLGTEAFWRDSQYVLRIRGSLRCATLFGSNITLRRTIETVYGSPSLTVQDELVNEGFAPHPLMLLYHINAGFPLLREGTRAEIPYGAVFSRDTGRPVPNEAWETMPAPQDNAPEQVYYHEGLTGEVRLRVRPPAGGAALVVRYSADSLPVLTQWISPASGAYAMGLEPGTCHVQGLSGEKKRRTVQMLAPGEHKSIRLVIEAEP